MNLLSRAFRSTLRNSVTLLLICAGAYPIQAQNAIVGSIIESVSIDSMMLYVSELSGELPVDVGNGPELIVSRHKDNSGNALAQAYIEQKFIQFGYTPTIQSFSATGRNVIVTKPGTIPSNNALILCAHYDAMPGGFVAAPAADDDGSGTAAVLEAARILADIEFEHTIIFALWDEEEQGLVGSAFYAGSIAANDVLLRGVINMDAIAYDGNGDTKARIHSRSIGNSHEIADSLFAMRDHYNIDLDLILTVPGASYSDHASFWNEGYGAILVIEEFGADGNPFYHTPEDRIIHFDVPYYEKLARISIATLATLAVPVDDAQNVSDPSINNASLALSAYPNPANSDADLWLTLKTSEDVDVVLFDALGKEIAVIHRGMLTAGRNSFKLLLNALPAGSYSVIATTANSRSALRVVRVP